MLRFSGLDVLRAYPPGSESRANLAGCFPLVPYSNRIAYGNFDFDGQTYELERNFGEHPHSLHGNGWQNAWRVDSEDEDRVILSLEHNARGSSARQWPWPFLARQEFLLTNDALHCTLSCTNLSDVDAPIGLGFHPNFARADQAKLCFLASAVVINGPDSLPASLMDVPEEWDFRSPRRPEPGSVDNCFIGWDGRATVHWPSDGLRVDLRALGADHLVVFVPSTERNFMAIEPVSHLTNAINSLPFDTTDHGGMARIRPGQTALIHMTLRMSLNELA